MGHNLTPFLTFWHTCTLVNSESVDEVEVSYREQMFPRFFNP